MAGNNVCRWCEKNEKLAFNKDRSSPVAAYLKEKIMKTTNTHTYLSWALIGAKLFKPSDKRIDDIKRTLEQGDNVLKGYLRSEERSVGKEKSNKSDTRR